MLISAIPQGLQAAAGLLSLVGVSSSAPTVPRETGVVVRHDALRSLAERYDVRNISPRALNELLRELKDSGAVSAEELKELSLLTVDDTVAGHDEDRKLDLIGLLTRKLEKLQSRQQDPDRYNQALAAEIATAQRQLDWLRKFQQLREAAPFDLAA